MLQYHEWQVHDNQSTKSHRLYEYEHLMLALLPKGIGTGFSTNVLSYELRNHFLNIWTTNKGDKTSQKTILKYIDMSTDNNVDITITFNSGLIDILEKNEKFNKNRHGFYQKRKDKIIMKLNNKLVILRNKSNCILKTLLMVLLI